MKLLLLCFGFYSIVHPKFIVQPELVVQAKGLDAMFECLYPGATFYIWGINSTFPTDEEFPSNFIRGEVRVNRPASLTIPALSQYNNTNIQCEAVILGNPIPKVSKNGTLQVQDSLEKVSLVVTRSTLNATITIFWSPPFTLNLTTAEPDIQYCVDVYNESLTTSLLSSECNITVTSFVYVVQSRSVDNVYNFKVTPLSNIPGALNGTPSEIQGYLLTRPPAIPYELITYSTNSLLSPIIWEFPQNVFGSYPGRFPTSYMMNLLSIDNRGQPSRCNCPATMKVIEQYIRLTLQWCLNCDIQRHRVYNYTIHSANNAGSSTSIPTQFSTHDVQLQAVTQTQLNNSTIIRITYTYLPGSASTGVLVIFQPMSNKSNIYFMAVSREEHGEYASIAVQIHNPMGELYSVVIYEQRVDHIPTVWPAGSELATIEHSNHNVQTGLVQLMSSSDLQSSVDILSQIPGGICINCSFLEGTTKTCITVVYQTTENKSLLENTIHTLNTSIGVKCFQLEASEKEYTIAVFVLHPTGLGRQPLATACVTITEIAEAHTDSSSTFLIPLAIITGSLLPLMLCLMLIILIIIVYLRSKKMKAQPTSANHPVHALAETDHELNSDHNPLDSLTANDAYNVLEIDNVVDSKGSCRVHKILPSGTVSNQSPPHIYEEPSSVKNV